MEIKKVGVIGSGMVGQALANGFIKHGYNVMIGTNNMSKRAELKSKTNGKSQIGTFEETAKFGEIVVLAVKGIAAETVVKSVGNVYLKGKTVIDATNPIAEAAPVNGVIQYFTTHSESPAYRRQAHGTTAKACSRCSLREVVFLRGQQLDGQSRLWWYKADDVHLWEQR